MLAQFVWRDLRQHFCSPQTPLADLNSVAELRPIRETKAGLHYTNPVAPPRELKHLTNSMNFILRGNGAPTQQTQSGF